MRSALYDVLATIPGVQLKAQTTDVLERQGTLIVRRQSPDSGPHSYLKEYLIVPEDGRLLEEREGGLVITYIAQGGVATDHEIISN